MASRIRSALGRRLGPLPAAAWLAIAVGGILLYRRWRGGAGAPLGLGGGSSAQSNTGLTAVPAPAVGGDGGGLPDPQPLQPSEPFTTSGLDGHSAPIIYDPVGDTYVAPGAATPPTTTPSGGQPDRHGFADFGSDPLPPGAGAGVQHPTDGHAPVSTRGSRPRATRGSGPSAAAAGASVHGDAKQTRASTAVRRVTASVAHQTGTKQSSVRSPAGKKAPRAAQLLPLVTREPVSSLVTPPGVRPRRPAEPKKKAAPRVVSTVAEARAVSRSTGTPIVDIKVEPKSAPLAPKQAAGFDAAVTGYHPTPPPPPKPAASKPSVVVVHHPVEQPHPAPKPSMAAARPRPGRPA